MNMPRKIIVNPQTISNAPVVFAEGVAKLNYSPNISRVSFFQLDQSNSADEEELRNVVLTLAIPTHALVELCVNILMGMRANMDQLEGVSRKQIDHTFKMLRDIQPGKPAEENRAAKESPRLSKKRY
ncbi:hypothetical protein [Variovorax soli]|nr:hypothetical protein [Variovorax soli]